MSEQVTNVMDAIYKNASMGEKSISAILSRTTDSRLRSELQNQQAYYRRLGTELANVYTSMSKQPKDIGALAKAFVDADIRFKMLTNPSVSRIAELMIEGTNMGIIELEKALNNNPDVSVSLRRDMTSALKHEQEYIDRLKEFL